MTDHDLAQNLRDAERRGDTDDIVYYARSVSSAPFQYDGGCRISPEESRGSRQRGV